MQQPYYSDLSTGPGGSNPPGPSHCFSYLALGDSYTIGEGCPVFESFPYQTVQRLRGRDHAFLAPEIVARTGWTTDELREGIAATRLLKEYDIVSLLIGVNNQYRGRPAAQYREEFEGLLQQALGFAGMDPARVFVLSIPDWGVTPFAKGYLPDGAGRTTDTVAAQIDEFNAAAAGIAQGAGIAFLDITPHTRSTGADPEWLAADGLHPSGREYAWWAEKLADRINRYCSTHPCSGK